MTLPFPRVFVAYVDVLERSTSDSDRDVDKTEDGSGWATVLHTHREWRKRDSQVVQPTCLRDLRNDKLTM